MLWWWYYYEEKTFLETKQKLGTSQKRLGQQLENEQAKSLQIFAAKKVSWETGILSISFSVLAGINNWI